MEVTYGSAIRIIGIDGVYYTVSELRQKRDRTRTETTVLNTAIRIFSERKKRTL